MILAALLSAGLLMGCKAQDAFSSDKTSGSDDDAQRRSDTLDVTDDIVDMITETNRDCVDDIVIKLSWDRVADLDLYVEGPDMCQISWRNPLSKWGGILERDVIPRMCREDERYEEIVRYGNGVANGGIWKIWAVYYSNGRCDTREVDYKITVHMGGKLVDTFSDTLRKEGDVGTMYNVLGFRSHPTRKHSCARREVRPSKRPRGRKGGRSLLSTRKTERKCVCFHGKTVRHRGECVMPST